MIDLLTRERQLDVEAVRTEWDELSQLVLDAWSWRDPESFARLETCIGRLRAEVEREWG